MNQLKKTKGQKDLNYLSHSKYCMIKRGDIEYEKPVSFTFKSKVYCLNKSKVYIQNIDL